MFEIVANGMNGIGERMKRRWRIGCLSVSLYCIATALIMHFGQREGLFECIAAIGSLHGGGSGKRWQSMVMDDLTAPVQVPMFALGWVGGHLADRLVPSRRAAIAFRVAVDEYDRRLKEDFECCLLEAESVVLTNAPARRAWNRYTWDNKGRLDSTAIERLVVLSLKGPEYMVAFYPVWYVSNRGADDRLAALEVIVRAKEDFDSRSAVYAILMHEAFSDEELRRIAECLPGHVRHAAMSILDDRQRRRTAQPASEARKRE